MDDLGVEHLGECNGGLIEDEPIFFDADHMLSTTPQEYFAYELRVAGSHEHDIEVSFCLVNQIVELL